MLRPRFYHPDLSDHREEITLGGDEASHALRSRRMGPGDQVTLIDGAGAEADATIVSASGRARLELRIEHYRIVERPLTACISIAVAVCKAQRQGWMVEKLAELGVGSIRPMTYQRSTVVARQTTVSRWRRRCIEAIKQSGQAWAPQLLEPMDAEQLATSRAPDQLGLLGHPEVGSSAILSALVNQPTGQGIIVVIGPEGGLTDSEVDRLMDSGFAAVRLGQTVLRVETAAVALVAAIVASLEGRLAE